MSAKRADVEFLLRRRPRTVFACRRMRPRLTPLWLGRLYEGSHSTAHMYGDWAKRVDVERSLH